MAVDTLNINHYVKRVAHKRRRVRFDENFLQILCQSFIYVERFAEREIIMAELYFSKERNREKRSS